MVRLFSWLKSKITGTGTGINTGTCTADLSNLSNGSGTFIWYQVYNKATGQFLFSSSDDCECDEKIKELNQQGIEVDKCGGLSYL